MSRQSMVPPRNLTLTEELERLEQSITLTLQEIDHNFSKAHRIVTSSIIPIIEQYAKHSDAVWDGSKFWKQFFEASANVSLSSYEEPLDEDLTAMGQDTAGEGEDKQGTPAQQNIGADDTVTTTEERPTSHSGFDAEWNEAVGQDSLSVTVATKGTTSARQKQNQQQQTKSSRTSAGESEASFAEYPSPYETLKAELQQNTNSKPKPQTRDLPPTTPGAHTRTLDFADSSPIPIPPSTAQQPTATRKNADRLLHNVLDKNYRLQATPHTARRGASASPSKNSPPKQSPEKRLPQKQGQSTATKRFQNPALDSSPFSPAPAAPQLRSEIFGSPAVRGAARAGAPRTPGVSVQSRARFGGGRMPGPFSNRKPQTMAQSQSGGNGLFSPSPAKGTKQQSRTPATARANTNNDDIWDSSDDDFDAGAGSPPKTLQFHIPQSRLMQTPAREASKRIVDDLLMSAGVPDSTTDSMEEGLQGMELTGRGQWDEEDELIDYNEEASPSVVRARKQEGDDTF